MSNRKAEIYQGAPCRRGHNGMRYVSFGGCVECSAGMARGEYEGEIVKRRRYTDAERETIKSMRLSGMTAQQVAEAIPGMTVGQVEGLFRTLSLTSSTPRKRVKGSKPSGPPLKYSPATYARIEELHAKGMSIRAIGRDVGISHNSVQGHINRNRAKFALRGNPIIYSDTPKPPPPPVEYWMRTLPALPSLIGHVELAPMAPWLDVAA